MVLGQKTLLYAKFALQCGRPHPSGGGGVGWLSFHDCSHPTQPEPLPHVRLSLGHRCKYAREEPPFPMPSHPPDQSGCLIATLTHVDYHLRAKSKNFHRDFELQTRML